MKRCATWCVVGALLITACKTKNEDGASSDAGPPEPQAGEPYNSCQVDADCGWGEIEHEILKPEDCVCLYGCPYIPLSKETVERRAAQHKQLCKPRYDGNGELCGIDDCAEPPTAVCNAGACQAAKALNAP
jgi:hypothetical protein